MIKGVWYVREYYDWMIGCHDESKHRAAMQDVVVSVDNGSATSTLGGHLKMTFGSAAHPHNGGTTLDTDAGDNSCSLVIRFVKCAGTGRHR